MRGSAARATLAALAKKSVFRRLWPQRVRTRLTVLYALLFLVAGSSLLALTYALLASRLPTPRGSATPALKNTQLLALCKQEGAGAVPSPKAPAGAGAKKLPDKLVAECKSLFTAGARAASQNQRDQTLSSLLLVSLIGLGVITLASAGLGWLLSGRALGPVRKITETARRASELHLGERLALTGPQDELKELADTFDAMLERLDGAFASQRRFVANAAHELRTPLTAMRTSIEVTLSKPSRTPAQLEAMADKVRRSIERSEATIEALLTLATSERAPVTEELVDLAAAAEDAIDAASPALGELELTLETAIEPAPTTGDAVLLERMIANLVDNAVRHNNRNGWVRVRTGETGGEVTFEVANSGPQVAERMIPTLFEPFGRAEQRLNPAEGVGLGLSIAKAISVAHGATLNVRSRAEGGLEVSIVLPRAGTATDPGADLGPVGSGPGR